MASISCIIEIRRSLCRTVYQMQIEACAFPGFGNAADSDDKIMRWMFAAAITSTREQSFLRNIVT